MSTLLLRFSGPLQGWGAESRFDERDTGTEPSRAGVIGLLAAALGLTREEPIARLAEIRLGVRIDSPGTIVRDFQTIQYLKEETVRRGGPVTIRRSDFPVVSPRFYLADATFTVAIEHPDASFLAQLGRAVVRPHWILALGRRACLPAEPMVALDDAGEPVLSDEPLEAALSHAPDPGRRLAHRFVVEVADGSPRPVLGRPDVLETRYDQPDGTAFSMIGRATRLPRTVGIFARTVAANPLPTEG